MPQTYVLYHDHCPDGFGAAWAFHRTLGCQECGQPTTYLPQSYGDPMPWMEPGSRLFILDFSYPRETILELQRTHECSASTTSAGSVNYSCRFTSSAWTRCWAALPSVPRTCASPSRRYKRK